MTRARGALHHRLDRTRRSETPALPLLNFPTSLQVQKISHGLSAVRTDTGNFQAARAGFSAVLDIPTAGINKKACYPCDSRLSLMWVVGPE